MLRKCTRYIFLLLFISSITLCCALVTNIKGNEKSFSKLATQIEFESGEDNLTMASSSDAGYTILQYDVDIKVAENNILTITETIDCVFTVSSHGIYRDIPLINKVKRTDGSKHTYFAKVTDISVNNIYTKSKTREKLTLKIGDANKYVRGEQTYVISYNYHLGKDGTKKYDELYFNIIGDEWTTSIDKVTFTITMPKIFDKNLIGFSSGYKGATANNITYYTNENVIYGETTSKLLARQAVTIRLELPNGYFVGVKSIISNKYLIFSYVIPALIFIIALIIFFCSRAQNHYVQTVEFYPPKDLNSLDVALIYKAKTTNKDMISLIVYLADKGFIKIEECSNNDIEVEKLKYDYSSLNEYERRFIEALFGSKNKVKLNSLKSTAFPDKISKITKDFNKKENRDKYILTKLMPINNVMVALSIVAVLCSTLILFLDFFVLIWLFPIIGFILLLFLYREIFIWIFMAFWAGLPLCVIINYVSMYGNLYMFAMILGMVFAISVYILSRKTAFRTKEGGELYAQIAGFKHFIKVAEKERLEALCNDDPTYFYNILPYAYVLGVSRIWIKKFENIVIQQAEWYNGTRYDYIGVFDIASRSAHSSSSSSGGGSSGGSSGGGFSGGGSGGGGGGRW